MDLSPEQLEIEKVMRETPDGDLVGRGSSAGSVLWEDDFEKAPTIRRRELLLDPAMDLLVGAGVVIFRPDHGRGGTSAHRGVLEPDDWVDADTLQPMLERWLGFTLEEFDSIFRRRGRPPKLGSEASSTQDALRARVDQSLLEIVDSERTNIELLAMLLGVSQPRIFEAACRARGRPKDASSLIDGSKSCTSSIAAARRATVPCSYRHVRLPGKTFDSREAMLAALEQL